MGQVSGRAGFLQSGRLPAHPKLLIFKGQKPRYAQAEMTGISQRHLMTLKPTALVKESSVTVQVLVLGIRALLTPTGQKLPMLAARPLFAQTCRSFQQQEMKVAKYPSI